jgi:hypothetical protein
VEVQIRVSGGDDIKEVTALYEWLRRERGLAGAVRAVQSLPGNTELGGAISAVAVAVGAGGAGTVLARSLVAWIWTRRPSVKVTVSTKVDASARTRSVTVDARDLDADKVLPLLRQVLSDDDG